ncbi:hypothetical protein [Streptomyces sp. NPDC053431]|uniref:hypothetical protein n=1 Tax=Streptomyces sp. NPDC053431 TaxID=3365703 RepID=UPI0037D10464
MKALILRDFDLTRLPSTLAGAATITYIAKGWLYLATVIDIASRRVGGWATVDHLRTELVSDALTPPAAPVARPTR